MANLEEVMKNIDTNLKMINLTSKTVPRILERKKISELNRTCKLIGEHREKIQDLKTKAQMFMFTEDKNEEEVTKYGEELDEKLLDSEDICYELQEAIHKLNLEEEEQSRLEREKVEDQKRNQKFEEEMKLQQMKLEMKAKFTSKLEKDQGKPPDVKVKLPKLVISKFQGNHLDWLRFWGQFESEIEKTQLSGVAKFSYLKELLSPTAKMCIEGLPFTSEGYERAKAILKSKYGKPSEVANAHMQAIIALPPITHVNVKKIHDFYEVLTINVQSLETMGKSREIHGYVRLTLDKLPAIRSDLVRTDDEWQEWNFGQLLEALRHWTERNPISTSTDTRSTKSDEFNRRDKLLQTRQNEFKQRKCIYCSETDHRPVDCKKVSKLEERRKILSNKRLCFNCTGSQHRAADCHSKKKCQHCDAKHHTSICDKKAIISNSYSTSENNVIHPTVLVLVNGIKCRTLLDTGAGSSYASATLIEDIHSKPKRT